MERFLALSLNQPEEEDGIEATIHINTATTPSWIYTIATRMADSQIRGEHHRYNRQAASFDTESEGAIEADIAAVDHSSLDEELTDVFATFGSRMDHPANMESLPTRLGKIPRVTSRVAILTDMHIKEPCHGNRQTEPALGRLHWSHDGAIQHDEVPNKKEVVWSRRLG
ncbi:hypothetical protein R1sor_010660 [Riccia sorocarpa]|uniref:Uncharacterized protein n=1 Tax=Riccia sorocarpa TaxID=122646 RepID=A0ABD3I234_9MARC